MNQTNSSDPSLLSLRVGPAQYMNREGVIQDSGHSILLWGNRALISGGKRALAAAGKDLMGSLEKSEIAYERNLFTGECCPENIAVIRSKAEDFKANLIIGVGGGKSLDTAKATAAELQIPVICIPTIAATCAATTAMSVLYTEKGIFNKALLLPRSPSLVLVDPRIIAQAPVIYLESGILDSLAKWYEGRAVYKGLQDPDIRTSVAIQLAEVLHKGFRQHSVKAVSLVRQQKVDESLVQVIDLVFLVTGMIQSLTKGTLFSGIPHAIHNGITTLEEGHRLLHGIKVGYGIVVQLYVENGPNQEFQEVVSFFKDLELNPSFKGLHLPYTREIVLRVAERAANDPYIGPVTYAVTKEKLASAMEDLEGKFGH